MDKDWFKMPLLFLVCIEPYFVIFLIDKQT